MGRLLVLPDEDDASAKILGDGGEAVAADELGILLSNFKANFFDTVGHTLAIGSDHGLAHELGGSALLIFRVGLSAKIKYFW